MLREERDAIREGYVGLEDGDLFFFYRPKHDDPHGAGDIERLSIVMHPLGERCYRVIKLQSPTLPPEGDPFGMITGEITEVTQKEELVKKQFDAINEQGRGGMIHVHPAARVCAEGVYSFVPHGGRIYLVYLVELPNAPFNIQKELGIQRESAFLLGVYNPEYRDEEAAEESPPDYSADIRKSFGEQRLMFGDVRAMLDYERTRIGLFGRNSEVARQHTADIGPEWERLDTADIFNKLHVRSERQPVSPLMGVW
ncbi:MAG: hypothetical protein GF331_05665 [Chitinivibrionales bacterium]|nr:hypothetical protein [Chitinivibrionales bacterium]